MDINPSDIQWDDSTPAQSHSAAPAAPAAPATPSAPAPMSHDDIQWDNAPAAPAPSPKQTSTLQAVAVDPSVKAGLLKIWNDPHGTAEQYIDFARHNNFQVDPADAQARFSDRKNGISNHISAYQHVNSVGHVNPPEPKPVLPADNRADWQKAGGAFVDHVANSVAGDYGAEVGGFFDAAGHTIAHPTDVGNFGENLKNSTAYERALLERDSTDHPYLSGAGEITGALLTAPIGNVASDAVGLERLGVAGAAATRGAVEGGIYGSGAAGPDHRLGGAVGGAVTGGVLGGVVGGVAGRMARTVDTGAVDAADRLNADLGTNFQPTLANSAQGIVTRAVRAGSASTILGGRQIGKDASRFVADGDKAKNAILDSVNPGATDHSLNNAAENVVDWRDNGDHFNQLFTDTKAAAGSTPISSPKTVTFLANEIKRGKAAGLDTSELEAERAFFSKPRTLEQILDRRSGGAIGDAFTNREGGVLNGALKHAWGTTTNDIQDGLAASGLKDVGTQFTKANDEWASRSLVNKVLGKGSSPDAIVSRVTSLSNRDGYKLAKVVDALPGEQKGGFLAGIVDNMGTAKAGQSNAGGWSPDQFATDWMKLKPRVKEMYPEETRRALDDLAQITLANKTATSLTNRSHTANAINIIHHIQQAVKIAEGIASVSAAGMGHVVGAVGEAAVSASVGKVLTSPRFTRVLVNIQKTGKLGSNLTRLQTLASRMGGAVFGRALVQSLQHHDAQVTPDAALPQYDPNAGAPADSTTQPNDAKLQDIQDQIAALQDAQSQQGDNPDSNNE